jgi:hypothetical protein
MNSAQHSFDAPIIAVSKTVTGVGSITAVGGGVADKAGIAVATSVGAWSIPEICALGGLLFALVGYLTSTYFQWRRDRRETAEWKRRMTDEITDRIIKSAAPSE